MDLARPVDSIRQAIVVLGTEKLRRLCAAVLLGKFDDRPLQLLTNTLIRARMCELLAKAEGVRETGPYFMTGLFSTLELRSRGRTEPGASSPELTFSPECVTHACYNPMASTENVLTRDCSRFNTREHLRTHETA